jgi:hypothetical protein
MLLAVDSLALIRLLIAICEDQANCNVGLCSARGVNIEELNGISSRGTARPVTECDCVLRRRTYSVVQTLETFTNDG